MNRLLRRIELAIQELDLGIPDSKFATDFLGAVNMALRSVGAPAIKTIEERGPLLRAALFLENSV